MKTITVYANIGEKHTIVMRDGGVLIFNHYTGTTVEPSRFDFDTVSRDFTGTVNSEEVFKAAARKRSAQSTSLFLVNQMHWMQGSFELQGWKNQTVA
ncbi:hypothetical protein [Duffyella gerundensis]|uniref:hypothetical protein n=1 Tax=Duffyella gerundensis TaxID=1619313 RepID=UPI0021F6BF56|nr:hypothetical protein [Duffyella gerundensis]